MLDETVWTRCPLLFASSLTLLLFLLGAALGRLLLRFLHLRVDDRLEYGLFAVGLGMGALSYIPFLLFSLSLGRPLYVVGVILGLSLAFLPQMLSLGRGVVAGLRDKFAAFWETSS